MNLRSLVYPPIAKHFYQKFLRDSNNIELEQQKQFQELLNSTKKTAFGQHWNLNSIKNYREYRKQFPIQQYEDLREFIIRASNKEPNVLWPGIPRYFAQTSGTISGKKFIPITHESFQSQRKGRVIAMANYSMRNQKLNQMKGPMLFFSSFAKNEQFGAYSSNLVSSIMAQNIPKWLRKYNLPSDDVHQIEDFSLRMDQMIREVLIHRKALRGIVSFPPWLNFFLEKLESHANVGFEELFPNFSLLVTSGMSYLPYQSKVVARMGRNFDHLETYPTSEGFIGFTDELEIPGFSLMPSNGVFFEFVKLKDVQDRYAFRVPLEEVELGEEYAILVSNNSGLMSYLIGDTVKFISLNPRKMIITGRINRAISLMSENVSLHNTDSCIAQLSKELNQNFSEYLCHGFHPSDQSLPHYRWILEAADSSSKLSSLGEMIHQKLGKINTLYQHYSSEGLIGKPEVILVKPGSFFSYVQSQKSVDFQQKMEHICVDPEKFLSCLKFMKDHQLIYPTP